MRRPRPPCCAAIGPPSLSQLGASPGKFGVRSQLGALLGIAQTSGTSTGSTRQVRWGADTRPALHLPSPHRRQPCSDAGRWRACSPWVSALGCCTTLPPARRRRRRSPPLSAAALPTPPSVSHPCCLLQSQHFAAMAEAAPAAQPEAAPAAPPGGGIRVLGVLCGATADAVLGDKPADATDVGPLSEVAGLPPGVAEVRCCGGGGWEGRTTCRWFGGRRSA